MEIIGYHPNELEQSRNTFLSLLHPDDQKLVHAKVKAQIDDGMPYEIELRLRHKSGHYVWVKSRAKVFLDHNGAPLYLAGSITDLTNDRRKDAETEEFESRYRTLFEMAKDGIVVHVGDEPVVLDCNETFALRLGYERGELIGQPLSIFTCRLSDDVRAKRREKVAEETHATFESIHYRKDGTSFPVEISSSIIRLNNRPAVLSIVRDNSERKAFETALLASEQRFKDFAETTADRLWEADTEFRYTFVTELPAEADRLDAKEMIGKRIWEFPMIDPTDENWTQHRAIVAAR
ncbi:MAG: PAS domain S-box protein, partial [Proteobacteria bacterium]|nr:PAS domain S-box protein [Pseudomonadota bacterium]